NDHVFEMPPAEQCWALFESRYTLPDQINQVCSGTDSSGKWKNIFGSNSLCGIGSTANAPGSSSGLDLRSDKYGQRIGHFGGLWREAVAALTAQLKTDGRDAIDLHVHDLRRSAHYQMRKAGIDSKTRRAIIGHKTGSMDDRYTVIDDEAFDDAIDKMNAYQKRKGMISELKELAARVESLSDAEFQRFVVLRQKVASGRHTERYSLTLDTPAPVDRTTSQLDRYPILS